MNQSSGKKNQEDEKLSFWKQGPWRKMLFFIGIPLLIAIVYYGIIASDIYVCISKFSVKEKSEKKAPAISEMMASAVTGTKKGNAQIVKEYIRSRSLLKKLQNKIDLKKIYSQNHIDFFSRLPKDPTMEEFIYYYRDMVTITENQTSGVLTLKVRAFNCKDARLIAKKILNLAEQFVNKMSNRLQQDTLSVAKKEVEQAKERVISAYQALQEFRNKYENIDPVKSTKGTLSIVQELESKLTSTKIKLKQNSNYLRKDSAQIKELKNKIQAIKSRIQYYRDQLTNSAANSMSNILQKYEKLKLRKELAQTQYKTALTSLETARKEARRKSTYLLNIVEPTLPDSATKPDRFLKIATVLAICLVGYAVAGLLIAAIREHQQ